MVNCPICEDNKTKLIFKKQKNSFFKCKGCKLVFIWPQPKIEKINRMYQELGAEYYLSRYKIELSFTLSFSERLNQIEPYRKNNRLLDVGCSTGAFLSEAKNRGWDVYGVEVSHPAVNYARDTLDLNVFCGKLKEASFKNEYFDVVNIWAVLEHVPDPLDILEESKRILIKGGLLFFCVPNFNCLPIRLLGKKYRYIDEGHLFYFTKRSIIKMLKKMDFKIIKIYSEYFSFLTFFEDCRGVVPETLYTEIKEKEIIRKAKSSMVRYILRPIYKIFIFFIRKLYLGEELRVLAIRT